MKDKIINIVVVAGMVIMANYPMYKSLKATAADINGVVQTIQYEINAWRSDIDIVQNNVENIRSELTSTIDSGISQTEHVLNKVKDLETEIKNLNTKIDGLKTKTIDKVKETIDLKSIIDIRG
tara:strand:+ start:1178 stop:1546 length:369 start_codon:yes stop_codon:yes gene_type:complete